MKRLILSVSILLISLCAIIGCTKADAKDQGATLDGFPSKPIEFIIPVGAGATMDLYARALTDAVDLGEPLKITNMPGASNAIALAELASRDGDGYSFGVAAFAGLLIQPELVSLSYDLDDFRPVAALAGPIMYTIAVAESSEIKNYSDFKKMLAEKDKVYWTSPTAGSPPQLTGLSYIEKAGIDNAEYVAYTGSAEGIAALLGGDIDFMIQDDSVVATQSKAGQLRGIITVGSVRSQVLPDLPTVYEVDGIEGMEPFDNFSFQILLLPADTPDVIYDYIKSEVDSALSSESFNSFMVNNNIPEVKIYEEEELDDILSTTRATVIEILENY